MSAKKQKKKKKFPIFAVLMLVYIVVGITVSLILFKKLRSWLTDYESSQAKYGLDEVLAALDANDIDSIIREDTLSTEMPGATLDAYRSVLKDRFSGKTVSVNEAKDATKEVPKYVLLADGEAVMDVTLKVKGKNESDMDLWTYDHFYPDAYNRNDTVYTITVLKGCVVRANGKALGDEDVKKDADGNPKITQIKDLKAVEQYLAEVPCFITYSVSGFLTEPQITAETKDGKSMELAREGNEFSADLPFEESLAAEVEAICPTIMEAYGKRFIGKNTGEILKYLLPDSEYKNSLVTAMTNFYPTEKIKSFTFDNESCSNFITYTENCVSVDIRFDLIVEFNVAGYNTENEGSEATWLFIKQDGTWYLAAVPRQRPVKDE